MIIRPMRQEDVEPVSSIEAATFSMPWSADDFREMVEAAYAHYFVAEVEGVPVGCVGIRDIAGEGDVTNVVVASAYKGQGIGRALLTYALEQVTLLGVETYTLEVRVSNVAAIHLYEELGFQGEGVRPDFYEKPREDALIMWKR